MKAKDFFKRAGDAEYEIRSLEALREHYIDIGTSIASHWGSTPPSGASRTSKVESAVLGMVEAEQGVCERIKAYMQIVLEAEKVISKIPQYKFRQILTLHYLAGLSLAETGKRLKYEDRNSIYRAHGWALAEAQKILDKIGGNDDG